MSMPFGWACCTISTRYRSSLRITVLGQNIGCFISFLPNSNWARPASISLTTLTGIVCYYPYIHLEGMRKPTKSLNITCKQAVLLNIFSPVQQLPARLCKHKILVYRLNVSKSFTPIVLKSNQHSAILRNVYSFLKIFSCASSSALRSH